MIYTNKFMFQFLYQTLRKSFFALMISITAIGPLSTSWAAGPASGSSSSSAEEDRDKEKREFCSAVAQASRINPIQEAASMYGNTTPMVTVKEESRTLAVLKQDMRSEENIFIAENFLQATASLKKAGFETTLARGYVTHDLSLTYQTSTGSEDRNFRGIVQPVVVLRPHANTPQTTLTDILDKMLHLHGALPAVALWSRSQTTKWVPMEEDEEPDVTHFQDYDIHERMKKVPVTPSITEAERNYCLNSISRDAVEGDFVVFLLTLSGDSQWRNWALELNAEGTLLGVKSIDYERLYLCDSTFDMTSPLAVRARQGLYPFGDSAREKILAWNLEDVTRSLDESKRRLVSPFLERLQYHLRQTPSMSLLNMYFRILADIQPIIPSIEEMVGFGWARGYENTNSRLTPVEELVAQMKSNSPLQDPAYMGLDPQWPDINFIQKHFKLGLHFQGSAVHYLRNPDAPYEDQSSLPGLSMLQDPEYVRTQIDKILNQKKPKLDFSFKIAF